MSIVPPAVEKHLHELESVLSFMWDRNGKNFTPLDQVKSQVKGELSFSAATVGRILYVAKQCGFCEFGRVISPSRSSDTIVTVRLCTEEWDISPEDIERYWSGNIATVFPLENEEMLQLARTQRNLAANIKLRQQILGIQESVLSLEGRIVRASLLAAADKAAFMVLATRPELMEGNMATLQRNIGKREVAIVELKEAVAEKQELIKTLESALT